jgi:hypothetical protein
VEVTYENGNYPSRLPVPSIAPLSGEVSQCNRSTTAKAEVADGAGASKGLEEENCQLQISVLTESRGKCRVEPES